MTTTTIFSTAADGRVGAVSGVSWADCQAGTTIDLVDSASTSAAVAVASFPAPNRFIRQGLFLYDTSVLGAGEIIDSFVYWFYLLSANFTEDNGTWDLEVRPFDWSPTVTAGDYQDPSGPIGTLRASLASSAFVGDALNALTSAAEGGHILKTATTYIALHNSFASDGTGPASGDRNRVDCRFADFAGTASDPKLVIVHHSPPESWIPYWSQPAARRRRVVAY